MDALSDVLKSMRLEGAAYVNAEFTAPWCVHSGFGLASVRARLAGAEQVMFFHYLTEGSCKVRLADGGEALDVVAGDLVLFTGDGRHLMGSDLHLAPVETGTLIDPGAAADGEFIQLRHGGGGAATRFVCGYLACTRSVCRPLLDALPHLLRIPVCDGPASALLRELLRQGVRESSVSRPGADSMLAKLSELMFVEAMRRYVEDLPPEGKGWLAGVRDPNRARDGPAACSTGQGVDRERARPRRRAFAFRAGRAVRGPGWRAAHAVPDALAARARGTNPALER